MLHKSLFSEVFIGCSWYSIISIRIYADPPSWSEYSYNLDIFRLHQFDEVFHYYINTVLMKVAVITEAEEI